MLRKEKALSLDLDGVVIGRPPSQWNAVRYYLRRGVNIYDVPQTVPEVTRTIRDEPLDGIQEKLSYMLHKRRSVLADIRSGLTEIREVDIFGNTGRSNKRIWIEMTNETLRRGGILEFFEDIFFKPEDITTRISKIAAVGRLRERYSHVTHYDDNPADALPIAALYPDVEVVVVQDLSTGILFSRVEKERYPNVRRVATLVEGLRKTR